MEIMKIASSTLNRKKRVSIIWKLQCTSSALKGECPTVMEIIWKFSLQGDNYFQDFYSITGIESNIYWLIQYVITCIFPCSINELNNVWKNKAQGNIYIQIFSIASDSDTPSNYGHSYQEFEISMRKNVPSNPCLLEGAPCLRPKGKSLKHFFETVPRRFENTNLELLLAGLSQKRKTINQRLVFCAKKRQKSTINNL